MSATRRAKCKLAHGCQTDLHCVRVHCILGHNNLAAYKVVKEMLHVNKSLVILLHGDAIND